MASPVYVWHGSSQDDADATWNSATIAYLTLELALAAVDAGGTVSVASEHSQTQASKLTLSSANGTNASPITIISVDKDNSDAYLPMIDDAAPGKIETTGANSIEVYGAEIYLGLTITSGRDIAFLGNGKNLKLYDCELSSGNQVYMNAGGYDAELYIENSNLYFTGNGYISFNQSCRFHWKGGTFSLSGGSVNTNLFLPGGSRNGAILVEDVDFQGLDAGDYLVKTDADTVWDVLFKRCKVPAALAGLANGAITGSALKVKFHLVSSSDIIYQLQENYYEGQINEDTATYYQATYDGTNNYSIKMVSSANAKEWIRPLRFKLADLWADTNPTLTVELNTDNVVLQNDEFWIEIEYPDGTTGALGGIDQTSRPATITTTPANLTTSAVAWTEAFGTEKPQKIEETISGGQAGIHTVWACLGKPSTTVYVCPKITVT